MAAEHAPPAGGGAADEPMPAIGDGGTAPGQTAAEATRPSLAAVQPAAVRGDGTAPARGRRLQPSGPALEHAPLLLGLDSAGGEHPQGGEHPDDEDLVGRVWGCVCGWRGAIRDISTRSFHPRVGDGGGLRRQRLARSDRSTRPDLDAHLSRSASAAADPSSTTRPAPVVTTPGGTATADAAQQPRARGRRRRLTVPRDTPLAILPEANLPPETKPVEDGELEAQPGDGDDVELMEVLDGRTGPAAGLPSTKPEPSSTEPGSSELSQVPQEGDKEELSSADLLAEAAYRAEVARVELKKAEAALDSAVAAARDDGLSWRSVGRVTGLGHREATARWGPIGTGSSP